jgi:hypothetical protein
VNRPEALEAVLSGRWTFQELMALSIGQSAPDWDRRWFADFEEAE